MSQPILVRHSTVSLWVTSPAPGSFICTDSSTRVVRISPVWVAICFVCICSVLYHSVVYYITV